MSDIKGKMSDIPESKRGKNERKKVAMKEETSKE